MASRLAGQLTTFPARLQRRASRVLARKGTRPAILMYHRIASPPFDPWGLSVSPQRFREQVETLVAGRQVLPMDELVEGLRSGQLPPRATALTFDDGYADNFTAKAILEELRVPATIFLTTGAIGSVRKFWWDELADLVFRTAASAQLNLEIGSARFAASWEAWRQLPPALASWRVRNGPRDKRTAAYLSLWHTLQRLPDAERETAIAALRREVGSPDIVTGEDEAAIMTAAMARTLRSDFIAVGGHAQSHTPLTALPPEAAHKEIAGGRADLAALTGTAEPGGFAYPHGEHDQTIRHAVTDAGYSWAVTTECDTVAPRAFDPYLLPRIAVGSWHGSRLLRELFLRGG